MKDDKMSPENFCYWLQGALELGKEDFNKEETAIIKEHLSLVFNKVTSDGYTVRDFKITTYPNINPTKYDTAPDSPHAITPVSC